MICQLVKILLDFYGIKILISTYFVMYFAQNNVIKTEDDSLLEYKTHCEDCSTGCLFLEDTERFAIN
jgi:hypothetical protein